MENAKMEQDSEGSGSSLGDAMSIFGQSIDVRRTGKSRRRATQKNPSSEIERAAKSGNDRLHQRRMRVESELSRGTAMARKLERQAEQTDANARPHRSELQAKRASSDGRKKYLVDVERPGGGDRPRERESSTTSYAELMEELDRVKRELRELQHEVKVAREGKGKAERDAEPETSSSKTSATTSSGSLVADGVKKRDADDGADEAHAVVVELAGTSRSAVETEEATRRTTSRASESSGLEAWLSAASSDERLHHAENDDSTEWEATAITTVRHDEHENSSSLPAAEAELESIKGEGLLVTESMERTREETARVADEITRLEEQEKKAVAQVQQLKAKLLEARSRLSAITAADEMAGEILADLEATLRQLEEEGEAAEKEKALTELESRCAGADAESVDAEIAAAEERIRVSVRELEAARASEASATERLRAAVVESAALARSAAVPSRRSGNVTIPRFEYEYLAGRAEVVRAVADKKVAAAEAWAEARRAGEKEMTMRAEAIERELGDAEAVAEAVNNQSNAEQNTPRDDALERAHPSKRPNGASSKSATVARRKKKTTTAPRSPVTKRVLIPNYLKLVAGRCTGRN